MLEKSENFDKFLHFLGVPYPVCKLAKLLPGRINVYQEAEEYTIETVTAFKKTKARFKPGKPFEEPSMGNSKIKSLITVENGVLHHHQVGDKEVNSTWEVDGDTLNILVNLLPVTVNIRQEADGYTIENVTTLKQTKAKFKLDEPFEETSMGDTTFKSLIRLENGELHYQQRGKKEINGTWKVDGETLNVVIKVEDIVCRRTYKRVE
ncbi:Fatty acid-binding protein 9 [Sparganum proliferum]